MENDFSTFVTQNYSLFALLGVIVIFIIGSEFRQVAAGIKEVSPAEATRLLNHDDAVLVDVRDINEHSQGHIGQDVHVPLAELSGRITELEAYKSRPVIAYCRSGHRSRSACAKLRKQGFATVYNLAGGILAWENAHLPITRK